MSRAQGARAQMALAFESTYGTAPGSGYTTLPFAEFRLSDEQPLIDSELLGYGRDPLAPIKDVISCRGNIVVPVDAQGFGYWLKGLLGAPTTTGTTPKTHTFASGGTSLPSASIERGNPEVPAFDMFSGVMVNSMMIRLQRSGNLQATFDVIAQGKDPDTATNAGTPGTITLTRFGHFHASIERDGSALGNIVAAELTYSNNLDVVETIRNDGKIEGCDPSVAALTGRLTARFANTTLLDQAIAGGDCELVFAWEIDANTSLTLTAHSVFLPRPRVEVSGPGGIQIDIDWQAAKAVSPARMFTAVLVNDVASY